MLHFYNSFCINLSHLLVVFLNGYNRCQTTRKPVVLGYLSILRSIILISQCLRVNALTLIKMMKTGMQAMRPLLVVSGMAMRPLLVVPGMATRHLVAKPSDSVRKGAQTSLAPSGKNLRRSTPLAVCLHFLFMLQKGRTTALDASFENLST